MGPRTALITGACGQLGAATCRLLADMGFRIATADIDRAASEQFATSLAGGPHLGIEIDVAREESVQAAFEVAEQELGPVSSLVTFAAVLLMRPGERTGIATTSVEDWQRTFDVNALGTFLCIREMVRRRTAAPLPGARIVTLSSVAAQMGSAHSSTSYAASKGAVIGLTKSVAREVAPLGITVNAIAPGTFVSPLMRKAVPVEAEPAVLERIPLGRLGEADELAATVAFLLSEKAGYLTGTVIDVNGGFRI